jgi:hypothetical protein
MGSSIVDPPHRPIALAHLHIEAIAAGDRRTCSPRMSACAEKP